MSQVSIPSLTRSLHTCSQLSYGMYVHTSYNACCNVSITLFITRSVRMSLIFSIIRITLSALLRRITLAVAACFFIFWAITISLQTWWCTDHPGHSECMISRSVAIFGVTGKCFSECPPKPLADFMVANCTADAMTMIFSLKLLWRVKLRRRQRRMLLSLFISSRLLCLFALAHSIAQLVSVRSVQDILANLQVQRCR